jgi:hypothetical protein
MSFLKLLESSQNYVISDIQVVNDILKEAKTLDFVNDPKKFKVHFLKINNNIKKIVFYFIIYIILSIINYFLSRIFVYIDKI